MKDKIFLITGGTSGIGKQIANDLCFAGATVVICYSSNEKNATDTITEFKKANYKFEIIKANVVNEDEIKKMFEFIETKFESLDGLINNAGIAINSDIENAQLNGFMATLNVNLVGKMLCIKYAVPLLKKSKNPAIINLSSNMGLKPREGAGAYCCSAAGINMLTEIAALELSKYNIRVNSVMPGSTLTDLSLANWTEKEIIYKEKINPRHRLGKPQDTSDMVLFLLSDKADYINGQHIRINGGVNLR